MPLPGKSALIRFVWRTALALALFLLLLAAIAVGRVPRWLILWCLAMSVVSVLAYAWDKHMAQSGGWRVSEGTLHLLDLAGGVVGGLLAQVAFRHKTSKTSFARTSVLIVLADSLALTAIILGVVDFPLPLA